MFWQKTAVDSFNKFHELTRERRCKDEWRIVVIQKDLTATIKSRLIPSAALDIQLNILTSECTPDKKIAAFGDEGTELDSDTSTSEKLYVYHAPRPRRVMGNLESDNCPKQSSWPWKARKNPSIKKDLNFG